MVFSELNDEEHHLISELLENSKVIKILKKDISILIYKYLESMREK